jgi:hypothetical protein
MRARQWRLLVARSCRSLSPASLSRHPRRNTQLRTQNHVRRTSQHHCTRRLAKLKRRRKMQVAKLCGQPHPNAYNTKQPTASLRFSTLCYFLAAKPHSRCKIFGVAGRRTLSPAEVVDLQRGRGLKSAFSGSGGQFFALPKGLCEKLLLSNARTAACSRR